MAIQDLTASLDLKQNLNIYATCKQFDNLNLILSIFDNSLQADLNNYDVRVRAMKADNVPLIQEHIGININSNIVNIEAHEQLTTTAGNTPIELQFIDKSTGEKKATFNLVLVVVASAIAIEASISKATYTLLEELEKKLDQLSDFFEHIGEAIEANTNLINSTNTANETKEALDNSNTTALATKSALDTSNTNATNTKNALDALKTDADNTKNALNTVNQTGQSLLNSLETFEDQHADVTNISNQLANINAELSENTQQIESMNTDISTNYAKKIDLETTNANVTQNANDMEVQKARIDNFASLAQGSTTGDAELIDSRIGADGINYANAGDAIRSQISKTCKQTKLASFVMGMPNGSNATVRASISSIYLKKGDVISFKSPYVGCLFYFDKDHVDPANNKQINIVTGYNEKVVIERTGYCSIIAKHNDNTTFSSADFLNSNTTLTEYYSNSKNEYENPYIVDYIYGYNDKSNGVFNFTNDFISSDRFFELDGNDVSIISDTNFYLIIFDKNMKILGNTYDASQTYTLQYLYNIVNAYSNAKYIRIIAQNPNGLNAKTHIFSGIKEPDTKINIILAASNSTDGNKNYATFICSGEDDREIIQQAMWLSYSRNCKVILGEGDYILNSLAPYDDGAPEKTCLWFNHVLNPRQYANNVKMFNIEGMAQGISFTSGARIILGDALYNTLGYSTRITLIRGEYQNTPDVTQGVSAISMKNLIWILPMNDKPITCVDLGYSHACDLYDIKCIAVKPEDGYGHLKTPPIAGVDCFGIKGLFGSNWNVVNTFKNIEVFGFRVGFDISGEHCLVENASAKYNYYGFTFNNSCRYGANHHPITCINMLDEHSVCMPLFGPNGSGSNQSIHIFGYNLMFPSWCSQGDIGAGDIRHTRAIEQGNIENGWGGIIHYTCNTTKDGQISNNQFYPTFFEKGGKGIRCINDAHKLAHSTSGRLLLEPNFMEQVFDITLNKPVLATTVGREEIETLTVTGVPTTAGNIMITLNGVAINVAVDLTMITTDLVATAIRNTTFSGWSVAGSGSVVTFKKQTFGTNIIPSFSSGNTGVQATIVITKAGVNNVWQDAIGNIV